jgi:hypothetical protein
MAPTSGTFPLARCKWQGWWDSNSQPPVLETGALPIELHPCAKGKDEAGKGKNNDTFHLPPFTFRLVSYSLIFVTTPEPTVLPPSRMAKRTPSSMAIGLESSTETRALSPGMHISAPPSKLAEPVTSVVRK